jgi:hypothetical protein
VYGIVVIVAVSRNRSTVWVCEYATTLDTRCAIAITVEIIESRGAAQRIQVVIVAVTVVIVVGSTGLPGILIDLWQAVVAVSGIDGLVHIAVFADTEAVGCHPVAVSILIAVVGDAADGVHIVGVVIAIVVVGGEARLALYPWVHIVPAVVAVAASGRIPGYCGAGGQADFIVAIAIVIGIQIPSGCIEGIVLVCQIIAVVVQAVTVLVGFWRGCIETVVAVGPIYDVAIGKAACFQGTEGIAKTIAIEIPVEREGDPLIDDPVAVIVRFVAGLWVARKYRLGCVVTVRGGGTVTWADFTDDLRTGADGTVSIAVFIHIGCEGEPFVDPAIAVVVDSITNLCKFRMPQCR